jgi:hypothetical protein
MFSKEIIEIIDKMYLLSFDNPCSIWYARSDHKDIFFIHYLVPFFKSQDDRLTL